jgi:hypothetical protein
MTFQFALRCIGASHLLQPPLTLLLSRQLGLARAFSELPPLPAEVARNMGLASVALPTCLGGLVSLSAPDVASDRTVRILAWMLALFWTWRLSRQIAIGPLMPRAWHWVLLAIFFTQGPAFLVVLIWFRG